MMGAALAPPRNRHLEYQPRYAGTSGDPYTLIAEIRNANKRLVTACQCAQRRIEEAEEANRLKDEFLATVAHELRTPLNAVLGWTRLLESHQVPPERADHVVAAIARSSCALANVVDDLLDTSRIRNGTLRIAKQCVDIVGIAQSAADAVRPSAGTKGVELSFETNADRRVITGDASRLQQVLWNLLANAIKFTPERGRVRVSVESSGDHVEVSVADTGDGISADFLPHVFERYRQAEGATTGRHTGLGLGLSIVRRLVELHGGTVRAASAGLGQGATFTVRLPLAAGDDGA